jgi:GNAT superfamily N-acetyltransferase
VAVSEHLEIRNARDDELDIVASLSVDAYAEYAARMSPDAWSSFAQDIANVRGRLSDAEILVAELDGVLVGSVSVFSEWRGAQPDTVGVRLLAVAPDHRGLGIGRALMEEVIARAKDRRKRRVVLTIAPEMEDVKALSEELGFDREPALDHSPAPGVRSEGYALTVADA